MLVQRSINNLFKYVRFLIYSLYSFQVLPCRIRLYFGTEPLRPEAACGLLRKLWTTSYKLSKLTIWSELYTEQLRVCICICRL